MDGRGIEPSPVFEIGWRLYEPVLRDALRYFFYQRQGIAIEEPFAEGFARGLGHPGDATAHMRSTGAVRDVSQGWYDAGDYGKYTPFAAAPIVDLLDAYEAFPAVFGDETNIPESGNGKADVLDEVKWELDWLLKMQDAESGGFYHLIYPNNCPGSGSCRPEDITEQRYVEDLMGGVGERAADREHGEGGRRTRPRRARLQGLRPGLRRPAAGRRRGRLGVPGRRTRRTSRPPASTASSRRTTPSGCGPPRSCSARRRSRRTTPTSAPTTRATRPSGPRPPTTPATRRCGPSSPTSPRPSARHRRRASGSGPLTRPGATQQLARAEKTWRNFLDDGSGDCGSDYYWGSNSVTLQTIVVIAMGRPGDRRATSTRASSRRHGRSSTTSWGSTRCARATSPATASTPQPDLLVHLQHDGIAALPPGILAEGPNQYQGWRYSRFFGKCYADTNTDWTVSEHAIYFNANLVFVLALADATNAVPAY